MNQSWRCTQYPGGIVPTGDGGFVVVWGSVTDSPHPTVLGRRYAGEVRQIITGSIGFDDWEWGVDLFAEDPLVFKKLIYEMRFDEVSAVYALFGTFYVGVRTPASALAHLLRP